MNEIKKELEKLPLEGLKIAADWWINQLFGITKQDNGDNNPMLFMLSMLTQLNTKTNDSDEDKAKYKEAFIKIVNQEWLKNTLRTDVGYEPFDVLLSVDYHPNHILQEIEQEAGISLKGISSYPWKTHMRINHEMIRVRHGYGSEPDQLYPKVN